MWTATGRVLTCWSSASPSRSGKNRACRSIPRRTASSSRFSTGDLKAIGVSTLVLHGEDDQIVPIGASARLSIKLLRNGTLKTYPGYGQGMLTVNADVLNADLLAFVEA